LPAVVVHLIKQTIQLPLELGETGKKNNIKLLTFRPTISSTFKQQRKGSGGDSAGPSSLRSLSGQGLTEEEAEALATMKLDKLKDDADASKGFVISFDDDTPKKPKPQLKQRRMSNKVSMF